MTVGETPIVASAKSISSPATELRATEAFEKRAASVRHRGYGRERESMVRTRSSGLNLWPRGNEETSAPMADTRFYSHNQYGAMNLLGRTYPWRILNELARRWPDSHDGRCLRLWLRGWDLRSHRVFLIFHQFVPNSNLETASDALRHLIPVHVPAALLCNPNNMAELLIARRDNRQVDGTSLSNQNLSLCLL